MESKIDKSSVVAQCEDKMRESDDSTGENGGGSAFELRVALIMPLSGEGVQH
jgi:hypothetical protein